MNLEHGKTYLNGNGKKVTVHQLPSGRFRGSNDFTYRCDGRWVLADSADDRENLVSEAPPDRWRVEDDSADGSGSKWWVVTDGDVDFTTVRESDARRLCDILNREEAKP